MVLRVRKFSPPWSRKFIVACPECGGKVETRALWFWEKAPDKLELLQQRFCHKSTSFLEKLPVLTENDWKSAQRAEAFRKDLQQELEAFELRAKPTEPFTYNIREHFKKHKIFSLIFNATDKDMEVLSIFLCIKSDSFLSQHMLQRLLNISRSYTSTILKKLRSWVMIKAYKTNVKGKARGRQLAYALDEEARKILDEDLENCDFFRETVVKTVQPIAEMHTLIPWRKEVLWPEQFIKDKDVRRTKNKEPS